MPRVNLQDAEGLLEEFEEENRPEHADDGMDIDSSDYDFRMSDHWDDSLYSDLPLDDEEDEYPHHDPYDDVPNYQYDDPYLYG